MAFAKHGGLMITLTQQGVVTSKAGTRFGDKINRTTEFLSSIGNFSEMLVRFAVTRRTMEILNTKGEVTAEAVHMARNILDFAKGGDFFKMMDVGIPYLGASTQATRGILRSAKENPTEFLAKLSWLSTFAIGLYLFNYYNNKEGLEKIADIEKVNNWVVPLWKFKDDDGNDRWTYLRIPKDQGQRLWTEIVEAGVATSLGHEYKVGRAVQAALEFIPIVPTRLLPPSLDALFGYVSNFDFWFDKNIWQGNEVNSFEEWTRFTNPVSVKIGKASNEVAKLFGFDKTGLSPKRLDYALSRVWAQSNLFVAASGLFTRSLMDSLPAGERKKTQEEILGSAPFARRLIRTTPVRTPQQRELESLKVDENTRRLVQNRELDALINTFIDTGASEDREIVFDFIKRQEGRDWRRLRDRFKRSLTMRDLSNRGFWFDLASLPADIRAKQVYSMWITFNPEKQKKFWRDARRVRGLISKPFMREFRMIISKEGALPSWR